MIAALTTSACRDAPLSTFGGAGRDAAEIEQLFWGMSAAALVIWAAMMALLFYCLRGARPGRPVRARRLILGGGVLLPTSALSLLVVTALPQLDARVDGPPETGDPAALRVHVDGEQWWWRVRYERPGGAAVELANELRLPRGRTAHLTLSSDNVIHAFWVPSLAGKIDMIPGRTTYLTLEPDRTGTFRGLCAEYCGASHARMAFEVLVMEAAEFEAWLEHQASPAANAAPEAGSGAAAFAASGCAACHTVRGTAATGRIGPDLTHVAGRALLAAATLPNDAAGLTAWIRDPAHFKPEVLMPPFAALGDDQVRTLSRYLGGLR